MNTTVILIALLPSFISWLITHDVNVGFRDWFHTHSEENFTMTGSAGAVVFSDNSFFTMNDIHDIVLMIIKVILGSIVGYGLSKFYKKLDKK
jgi:hypothetical protein